MNNTMQKVFTSVLLALIIIPSFIIAQDNEDGKEKFKPTVVVSSNIVPLATMNRYVELTDKYWVPAFDKLVNDGKLFSWGYLTHAWGDEWNVVVHYTAKDFATFQSAWSEGLTAFLDIAPEEDSSELIGMISAHKDGIYTGQHFYDGRPHNTE